MTAVYIAASSQDIHRAKRWRDALLEAGLTVTSTWIESIEAAGEANPRNATREVRAAFAGRCYSEVRGANILWFLAPDLEPSCGAWCELGYAEASCKPTFCSGPGTSRSIFCAIGEEFPSDFLAFAAIVRAHEQRLFMAPDPEGGEEW